MATCARCGTIMASGPGMKCPSCGAVSAGERPVAEPALPAAAPAPEARPMPTAIDKVALGLTLLMYAALALLLAIFVGGTHSALGGPLNVACFLLALGGVLLVGTGLGFSTGVRLLHAVLMFVPLVNLVVALVLVARATRALKAAGYRIGFMGVKR